MYAGTYDGAYRSTDGGESWSLLEDIPTRSIASLAIDPTNPNVLWLGTGENASQRSAGYGEIQRIIREEDPPRPSTRASSLGELLEKVAEHRRQRAGRLQRALRGELDWIVMKCLEKERTRRSKGTPRPKRQSKRASRCSTNTSA